MWTCPVCKHQCDDNFCAECGFEYSAHFEQFPTLQKIAAPTPAVSRLQKTYQSKNAVSTCLCCGSTLTNQHCLYCGFVPSAQASAESAHLQVVQHALGIVKDLTDFYITAYRYAWVPERSRLERKSNRLVKLGDANSFFNATVWSEDKFAQLRSGNDTSLTITLNYKYKGNRKTLTCAIPTVKTDDFWRIGISLDLSFHLKFYLGSGDKIVESAPIALDLT